MKVSSLFNTENSHSPQNFRKASSSKQLIDGNSQSFLLRSPRNLFLRICQCNNCQSLSKSICLHLYKIKEILIHVRVLLLVISIQFFFFNAYSQDTLIISRGEVIQRVLESNLELKAADQQTEMSRGNLNQSKALFLPSVSASYTSLFTNNPLMAFGSRLNQEILTASDFDPNRLNNPDKIENFATEIQALQPLLNLDGVYQRQAAQVQLESYELQATRTREYMELEATKAYMQLQLAYEALAVLKRARATADEGVRLTEDYFEQGLLKKADQLDVRVRQIELENQLVYARSNIQNASDDLATLLGETLGNKVYQPKTAIVNTIARETFSATLLSSRKDLLAMGKSIQGYEKMLKANKASTTPRINAFGRYQVFDDTPLGFGADGYLLGIQLSWSLFDGNERVGKVQRAKAALEKATIEKDNYQNQSQLELNKANRQLANAGNKVNLLKSAFELKVEAYRIRKNRYAQGLEKTADVLMAETQMFQKELEYKQALFEYNLMKEYLRFLTR